MQTSINRFDDFIDATMHMSIKTSFCESQQCMFWYWYHPTLAKYLDYSISIYRSTSRACRPKLLAGPKGANRDRPVKKFQVVRLVTFADNIIPTYVDIFRPVLVLFYKVFPSFLGFLHILAHFDVENNMVCICLRRVLSLSGCSSVHFGQTAEGWLASWAYTWCMV